MRVWIPQDSTLLTEYPPTQPPPWQNHPNPCYICFPCTVWSRLHTQKIAVMEAWSVSESQCREMHVTEGGNKENQTNCTELDRTFTLPQVCRAPVHSSDLCWFSLSEPPVYRNTVDWIWSFTFELEGEKNNNPSKKTSDPPTGSLWWIIIDSLKSDLYIIRKSKTARSILIIREH